MIEWNTLFRSLGITRITKLGGCGFCMRAAFTSAASAWVVTAALAFAGEDMIAKLAGVAALMFSVLWVAHLMAFAGRATSRARYNANGTASTTVHSRREMFSLFARSVGIVAALTVLPTFALPAYAEECDNCDRKASRNDCYTCCSCKNGNCVKGCATAADYNACVNRCSTELGNCHISCRQM